MSQPQQHGIRAVSVTYTTAYSNARSLIHCARPGIKPTTSWFLVRFVSDMPQWELQDFIFFKRCFIFFSIIVDLQCSVNFCYTAKWPSHTSYSFSSLSSIRLHHKWLDIVPCAIQQDLIAYSLQMQEFASINPRLPVHPTPSHSPLATTSLFSKSISFFTMERFVCAMY